jgi:hypothetical protein
MKVSEKSLELNVGAELLIHLRSVWGLKKAYLRGLTQREEKSECVDFFVQLNPATRLFAFQFKAPKGRKEKAPYKFTIAGYQHDKLFQLASMCPAAVHYVLPFYVSFSKLQAGVPTLMNDTWLLDVGSMPTASIFSSYKTRTVSCNAGTAKVNPEYHLQRLADIRLPDERGLSPGAFADWYARFRRARDTGGADRGTPVVRQRRNPWLARGLRVVIVPPS